jgi:hypothetical protein
MLNEIISHYMKMQHRQMLKVEWLWDRDGWSGERQSEISGLNHY